MLIVEFHPEAVLELNEAIDWYSEREPSIAWALSEEVRIAVESLKNDPVRYPMLGPRHRFLLLKRFPYLLVFQATDQKVYVLAVAHAARRPGYWRKRD